jgi:hypothetical protein
LKQQIAKLKESTTNPLNGTVATTNNGIASVTEK